MVEIRKYPDPVLSRPAQPVRQIDKQLLRMVEQMFETMYENGGVGLAAPQVGMGIRICVVNCTGESGSEVVLVNPVIVETTDDEATEEEGCLSVPGVRSNVTRAAKIKVRAYDHRGKELELEADGLEARAMQHEIDHLNGRLFFQTLNAAARMTINPQLKALEEEYNKK